MNEYVHKFNNELIYAFNEFERKIRRLIYLILIKAFGKLWVQEAINDELKKN